MPSKRWIILALVLLGLGAVFADEKTRVAAEPLQLKPLEASPEPMQKPPPSEAIQIKPMDVKTDTPSEQREREGKAPRALPAEGATQAPIMETVPFQPTPLQGGMAVELVLDTSGSMNGILGADTKISLVKSILEDLAGQWATQKEPPLQLALRLFGAQQPLEANQCDDSQLLIPFGPIDPATIKKNIEPLQAKGSSPIAYALRKAGEDLSAQAQDRVIVLLSDGKDTCEQDPCNVARELHEGQFKIITHVVAFDVAQPDEAALRCIAENAKGVFLLARTRDELTSALDEALRSTIPYNLRLKILVGATPLPTTVTVYKAGTQEIVQRKPSYGIELFRLSPGAYDILVEYADSIEETKPSKILKGVELTEQGKIEQEIRFDLASVTLSAHDAKGEPAPVEYVFHKAGAREMFAKLASDGKENTAFMAPGQYDLVASRTAPEGQEMTLTEPGIKISVEQSFVKHFSFQTGALVLKGITSQKQPVPILYHVTRANDPEAEIAKGQVEIAGGNIDLPPGTYDIFVEGQDPAVQVQPRGELKGINIEGGAIVEQTVTLKVGQLNLVALKAGNQPAPAEFSVTNARDNRLVAKITSQEGIASFALSPGKYNIQTFLLATIYAKPPTTELKDVVVEEGKTAEQKLQFNLGALKLQARNLKEAKIKALFHIFNWASDDVVATAGPMQDWIQFDLAPGTYDVKATDTQASAEPKPTVWLRDIKVETDTLYVREAVFTNARIRLIGRGTNNEVIPVEFKIYEYGHDIPVLKGTTGQDWLSFDITPGKYYVEAAYTDMVASQILKKWINLRVEENGFIEQELRF